MCGGVSVFREQMNSAHLKPVKLCFYALSVCVFVCVCACMCECASVSVCVCVCVRANSEELILSGLEVSCVVGSEQAQTYKLLVSH